MSKKIDFLPTSTANTFSEYTIIFIPFLLQQL